MTQIQQIKAEIERRIKIHQQNYKEFNDERFLIDECEDEQILSFIESLEKEQGVDLEKEINEVWEHDKVLNPYSYDKGYELQLDKTNLTNLAYHFYELGLNAKENTPKIKGWVARDKDINGLYFHTLLPKRKELNWISNGLMYRFNPNLFPYLKWEDEPIEVELIINRV